MTEALIASDKEFAEAVMAQLWEAEEELRLSVDGSIRIGPSKRIAWRRKKIAAQAMLAAAQAKRERKAAKLRASLPGGKA